MSNEEQQTENLIKTEIKLSEESVKKIVTAEAAKAIAKVPQFMEAIVGEMLFYREKKNYSSDPPKPTLFERAIKKAIQPIIEEEVKSILEDYRPKLVILLKRFFKGKIIESKKFENTLIEKLTEFTGKLEITIPDERY